MKANSWVASRKPVFQSPLFFISLALPLVLGISFALIIIYIEDLSVDISGGKEAIDLFWEYMKFPIAISSLSIPLASWVVANHRSAQLVETIEKQEVKRLHDLYYDHSEYFSKTFGRFVETHHWKYLERGDLYLIHRQLYFQNLEEQKDILEPNTVVIDGIKIYCRNIDRSLDSFIQDFTNLSHAKKYGELDTLCYDFTTFLTDRIMMLAINLGSRPLIPDTSLQVLLSAPVEITSLYKWIIVDHEAQNFDGVSQQKADQVANLVMKHLGVSNPDDMNLSAIEANATIRQIRSESAT